MLLSPFIRSCILPVTAILLFVMTGNAQQSQLAAPVDSGPLPVLQQKFQQSMRGMDSLLAIPTTIMGPHAWEEEESTKAVQKLFRSRALFYPYGNVQGALDADSLWVDRIGITPFSVRPYRRFCNNGQWQASGPVGDPEPSDGSVYALNQNKNGRLDCMAFDPDDYNTLYVGSGIGGGLWKVNGATGSAVSMNTDRINVHNGVGAVAAISGRVVIALGQSYNYFDWNSWETSCTGVFYTNNQGASWQMATVTDKNGQNPFTNYGPNHLKWVSRITVHPSNPNRMMMTMYSINVIFDANPVNYGALFQSTDGGLSWNEIDHPALGNRYFKDVQYHPTDPDIIYLSGHRLYKSENGGISWTDITSYLNGLMPLSSDLYANQFYGIKIMVPAKGCSPSDADHVALIANNHNQSEYIIYHSTDALNSNVNPIIQSSFEKSKIQWRAPLHCGWVMTHDPNVLYMGGTKLQRSDNGGISFATNHGYGAVTHADIQQIGVPPYNGSNAGLVFACTDGGLWRSTDYGNTFTSINSDLVINQFFGITASQSDNTVLGGTQDNHNIRRRRDGTWHALAVGDGSRFCAINPSDPEVYAWADHQNTTYMSYKLRLSPTNVVTETLMTQPGSGFRPILYQHDMPDKLMVATDRLYYVNSGVETEGQPFKNCLATTEQPNFSPGNAAVFVDYCHSYPNIVYASTMGQWMDSQGNISGLPNSNVNYNDPNGYIVFNLFKSTDGGATWSQISPNMPGVTGMISSIAVHPNNPNKLWITYSGFQTAGGLRQNVYMTSNGGGTWESYSQGLPKGSTQKIIYRQGSNDQLFLAMESGIFYRNANMLNWECFENNLPFTVLKDISISYCSGKIYAATYGRGVWESPMDEDVSSLTPVGETDVINVNTTWTASRTINGSIRVKSGVTLTISGNGTTIYMPSRGRILVEKGAKLIIDGARLTNECKGTMWLGIQLQGDINKQPLASYQGYLELKNDAKLEHARLAITNFDFDDGQGGGIIKASNSHIDNCKMAVCLNNYPNQSYYTSGTQSNCSFYNVSFIKDDQAYEIDATGYFTSWLVKNGVEVRNCTFHYAVPWTVLDYNKRSWALSASATGIRIENNSFEGFRKGVYLTGYSPNPNLNNAQVNYNSFSRNSESITASAFPYADIRGNVIQNMYPYQNLLGHRAPYGIYVNQATGAYVGCGNDVNGLTDGAGPGPFKLNRIGIIVHGNGTSPVQVIDNSFHDLTIGTQAQFNNLSTNIFCNLYRSNRFAWSINPESVDYSFCDQGTSCDPVGIRAGNRFIDNLYGIASYTNHHWSYYAGNGADESTFWSGAMTMNDCNTKANSQCNRPRSCPVRFVQRADHNRLLSDYSTVVNEGGKYSFEGRTLQTEIVWGYNDLDDVSGLRTFLESENDDESRKLLIPLYVDMNLVDEVYNAINALSLPFNEKQGYTNYYNVLMSVKHGNRKIDNLNIQEQEMVREIAASNLEVSPFAKGLLEYGYQEEWEHPIEETPLEPISKKIKLPETPGRVSSHLSDAVPNPAGQVTHIDVLLNETDAERKALLIIRNTSGREIYRSAVLKAGTNSLEVDVNSWEPGIYFYSLTTEGKVLDTKKLSIIK